MADTLASLRKKVYIYLGTSPNDPYYPSDTVDLLLNEAYLERCFDIRKENPNLMGFTATLTTASPPSDQRLYTLPADFGSYLDVRITDQDGVPLREYALEDANANPGAQGFFLNGTQDGLTTLRTLTGVEPGATVYLLYVPKPVPLSNDTDVPVFIPNDHHGLLSMDAAFVAYSMGGEQEVPPAFMKFWADKEARFWNDIGSRGNAPTLTRTGNSQTWPG